MLLILLFFKTIKSNETEDGSENDTEEFYCSKTKIVDNSENSILSNDIFYSETDICISSFILRYLQLEIDKMKSMEFKNNSIIQNFESFRNEHILLILYFKGVAFLPILTKRNLTYLIKNNASK